VSPFTPDRPDAVGAQPLARRNLLVVAQFAGLLATAWLVWRTSVVPRLNHQTLASLVSEALQHAFVAGASCVCITLALYLMIARSSRIDGLRIALRTSATAVWLAPATILLSAMSPAALAAALVLVASTTRLLYSQWAEIHPYAPLPVISPDRLLFEPPPSPLRIRDLIPGLAASFGVQAGVIAIPAGYPLLAAALFCLSVSMVTLSTLLAGVYRVDRPTTLPRSLFGVLLTVILAAGLTVGGLSFGFGGDGDASFEQPSGQPGLLQRVRELTKKLAEKKEDPLDSATKIFIPPADNIEVADDSFTGVILWPEAKPAPKLIAPSASSPLSWLSPVPTKPLTIPFSGQYWMWKFPRTHPPKDSYFRRTTPLAMSFVTTDHRPLAMDARQKLDHAIDLSCCGAIRISLMNQDRYPGTVSLEMILSDSGEPSRLNQSLGRIQVSSRPQRRPFTSLLPVPETLTFDIPAGTRLRAFDEIQVIFHREMMRVDRSARMSIEEFVLIPRT
jgi:hypothetical protein